jgi:hypothetical protein
MQTSVRSHIALGEWFIGLVRDCTAWRASTISAYNTLNISFRSWLRISWFSTLLFRICSSATNLQRTGFEFRLTTLKFVVVLFSPYTWMPLQYVKIFFLFNIHIALPCRIRHYINSAVDKIILWIIRVIAWLLNFLKSHLLFAQEDILASLDILHLSETGLADYTNVFIVISNAFMLYTDFMYWWTRI